MIVSIFLLTLSPFLFSKTLNPILLETLTLGPVYLAIYNNAIDFNSRDGSNDRVYYGIKENVKIGNYIKEIELNKGIYSVKIYIDKNYNNKFDFNIFGLPKEQYGFSNDAMNLFGAPDFEKALIKLNINKTIKINLR